MPELGPYGSVRGARGNSRPYRESLCTHSIFGREQSINAKRVAEAESVGWRIIIQPERDMEIQLLTGRQEVHPSRVQQQYWTNPLGVVANIFREQA